MIEHKLPEIVSAADCFSGLQFLKVFLDIYSVFHKRNAKTDQFCREFDVVSLAVPVQLCLLYSLIVIHW